MVVKAGICDAVSFEMKSYRCFITIQLNLVCAIKVGIDFDLNFITLFETFNYITQTSI